MGKTYLFVVFGTFLAKIIGFLREVFFAKTFGASSLADNYFQIFGLITLIFTGVGVALSTLIIKNMNKQENKGEEQTKRYVSCFLQRTFLILCVVSFFMYVFSSKLTYLLLPNVTGEAFIQAHRLMYIMIPSVIFVIIAYEIVGVLQNSGVFFITSIMSLPFNVFIICSLFIPNVSIYTIAFATTLGWFFHIVIQLPSFYKKGYTFLYNKKGLLKEKIVISYEVIYIFISNVMIQLCFVIDKAFVSGDSGKISILNYASNLFVIISSIFIVSMCTVTFPRISRSYETQNYEHIKEIIQNVFTVLITIFLPFLLVVLLFGEQIIALIYERGKFTHEFTILTSQIFVIYSFGILGYIAQEVFNKILYLLSKYSYTLIGTVIVVGLNILLDWIFVPIYGVKAAAFITMTLLICYGIATMLMLYRVFGKYFDKNFLKNLFKIIVAVIASFVTYIGFYLFVPNLLSNKILFILPIFACGIVYAMVLYKTKVLGDIVSFMNKMKSNNEV